MLVRGCVNLIFTLNHFVRLIIDQNRAFYRYFWFKGYFLPKFLNFKLSRLYQKRICAKGRSLGTLSLAKNKGLPKFISGFNQSLSVAHAPSCLPIIHITVVMMKYRFGTVDPNDISGSRNKMFFFLSKFPNSSLYSVRIISAKLFASPCIEMHSKCLARTW